jgi:hypothetical protein
MGILRDLIGLDSIIHVPCVLNEHVYRVID